MKAVWTPELVKQCLDLGFELDDYKFSCTTDFIDVVCILCPLYMQPLCGRRMLSTHPELLTIFQTHFPEHLL